MQAVNTIFTSHQLLVAGNLGTVGTILSSLVVSGVARDRGCDPTLSDPPSCRPFLWSLPVMSLTGALTVTALASRLNPTVGLFAGLSYSTFAAGSAAGFTYLLWSGDYELETAFQQCAVGGGVALLATGGHFVATAARWGHSAPLGFHVTPYYYTSTASVILDLILLCTDGLYQYITGIKGSLVGAAMMGGFVLGLTAFSSFAWITWGLGFPEFLT